jgi:hypothetical protein
MLFKYKQRDSDVTFRRYYHNTEAGTHLISIFLLFCLTNKISVFFFARFVVLTSTNTKMAVFWDLTLCGLLDID